MRKILLSLFFVATLSFARSVDETVAQIRRDYNETNSYKNYDIVTQPAEDESELEIKRYYNGVSREDERYYYDEDGELVRFIDGSGEVYEDEDGLDGDYGFYGNQKWED